MNLRVPSDPQAQKLAEQWPALVEEISRINACPSVMPRDPGPPARPVPPSRQYMFWTEDEKAALERLWPSKHPLRVLEVAFQRNEAALRGQAQKMGLYRK